MKLVNNNKFYMYCINLGKLGYPFIIRLSSIPPFEEGIRKRMPSFFYEVFYYSQRSAQTHLIGT